MGVEAEKCGEICVEVVAEVRSDGDKGARWCGEGMIGGERYVRGKISEFIRINRN